MPSDGFWITPRLAYAYVICVMGTSWIFAAQQKGWRRVRWRHLLEAAPPWAWLFDELGLRTEENTVNAFKNKGTKRLKNVKKGRDTISNSDTHTQFFFYVVRTNFPPPNTLSPIQTLAFTWKGKLHPQTALWQNKMSSLAKNSFAREMCNPEEENTHSSLCPSIFVRTSLA